MKHLKYLQNCYEYVVYVFGNVCRLKNSDFAELDFE